MVVSFRSAPDPAQPPGPRWRVGLGAAVVVVLVLLAVTVAVSAVAARGGAGETAVTAAPAPVGGEGDLASGPGSSASVAPGTPRSVFVHVHGHVQRPGLYELPAGARVVDVVAAAGGLTETADEAGVNLARPLVDGEQLRVPAPGDPAAPSNGAGGGGGAGAGPGAAAGPGGAAVGPVDLNRADEAALQSLPGVGPATSSAILEWREQNGAFRSVDDLLEVSGIGEKTVEKLRPLVTV